MQVEHEVPAEAPVLVAVRVVPAVRVSAAVQAEVLAGHVERAALPAAEQVWAAMSPVPVVQGDPSLRAGLPVPASKRGLPVPADPEVPADRAFRMAVPHPAAARALMASVVRVSPGVLSGQAASVPALKVVLSVRAAPADRAVPVLKAGLPGPAVPVLKAVLYPAAVRAPQDAVVRVYQEVLPVPADPEVLLFRGL